ncbi:MAG: aldo/keto reductase [Clostridiales bacterium]|nr:aldo/keto reductase [Clostridiales bacterium]
MKYRKFGSLDWDVSVLGFGCMRLPTKIGQGGPEIDETEAVRMIRHAIDNGVNYIDTAYFYHQGQSEILVGKALQEGYRDKVKLATKLPMFLVNETADYDKYLNEQLQKLQTDHIDFYLFHGIDKECWVDKVLKLGLLEKAEAARRDGRIRHIGFSFHGDHEDFMYILDGYDKWEFCQIQYNYMDIENQAGLAGLKHAASKGIAVVVMEPLLGGKLASAPAVVAEVFNGAETQRTPAEWAFHWVWSQSEVSVVLSGMSSMEQVEQNLVTADESSVGKMTEADLEMIEKVRAIYKGRAGIPCTACGYCQPCPSGVDIPEMFKLYNEGEIYDSFGTSKFVYNTFIPEKIRASNCTQCAVCEEKCPQGIKISEWIPKVHEKLK